MTKFTLKPIKVNSDNTVLNRDYYIARLGMRWILYSVEVKGVRPAKD